MFIWMVFSVSISVTVCSCLFICLASFCLSHEEKGKRSIKPTASDTLFSAFLSRGRRLIGDPGQLNEFVERRK